MSPGAALDIWRGDDLRTPVNDLRLADKDLPEAFDAITRLATRLFQVPVALISIVEEINDRQFFASQQGLCEPWASQRQTPLSHSFCKHVKRTNAPLVIDRAPDEPLVRDNLAVTELNVIAYLGVPIMGPDGRPIGAVCVIESNERHWTDDDLATLQDLASCVNDELRLRGTLLALADENERTRRYSALRESIALAFMAPDLTISARFRELLRASCLALDFDVGQISKVDGDNAEILFFHARDGREEPSEEVPLQGSLASLVVSGQRQVQVGDIAASDLYDRHLIGGRTPASYVGTPLIFDGALYGAIEFASDTPRTKPWSDEELSMLSIISMFVCAHLGIFGQLQVLKASEAALFRHILADRPNHLRTQRY
ncbi:MAG: GAF domain-containing protein [Pseudomonadota bacterium]